MQKIIITILLTTCIEAMALCQNTYYTYAAPYLYSANAGGSFSNVLNAAFNPSLIPFIKKCEAAGYAEKKYITDINVLLLSVAAPFDGNGVSLMVQRFGNASFSENIFGLSYGKSVGIVNVGILFQNIQLKIPDAERKSLIKAGFASSLKLAENVFVSCRVINPHLFTRAEAAKLHAASSFSLSFGYEASPEVYAGFESLKEEGRPLSLIFSLQYKIAEKYKCAVNWSTYTSQPYAAIAWQQKWITVEAGCSYHATLGPSPGITFFYQKPAEK